MTAPGAYVTPTSGSQAAGLGALTRIAAAQAAAVQVIPMAPTIPMARFHDFPEGPRRTVRRGWFHRMKPKMRGITRI